MFIVYEWTYPGRWEQGQNFWSLTKALNEQQELEYTFGVVCRVKHITSYYPRHER